MIEPKEDLGIRAEAEVDLPKDRYLLEQLL